MRSPRVAVACVAGALAGLVAAAPASAASTRARRTSTPVAIVTPDGRTRTYHLTVPHSAKGATKEHPLPLLVALHGGFGSGTQFEAQSGFDQLAAKHRFIVAYPDGIGGGPRGTFARTWNGGACCGPAMKANVDDVGFIRTIIDQLSDRYPIDPARVFVAGHSNGGIMAYRLACELSDRIAAIGVQSTSLEFDGCAPSHPVSLLHIHGTADENIPIDGGKGSQAVSGVTFNPPLTGVQTIARADGCSGAPTNHADPKNPDVTTERWSGCPEGVAVEFVKVAGAPHPWMGHHPTRPGVRAYQDFDSSAAIWAFLAAHPKV